MGSDTMRLVLRLAYLSGVLFLGGWIYGAVYRFEGDLVLAVARAERTVVATGTDGGLAAKFMPAMPPELIQASNPRVLERGLDPNATYVSAQLPFAAKLTAVEVLAQRPPRYLLELRVGRQATEVAAETGTHFSWGGGEATVRETRPWLGLVRTASAGPMAALSVRRGQPAWTRGVYLHDGAWRDIEGETGLLFRWWKNEAEAKARFPHTIGPFFGARWGAVDGGAVNWFGAMTPGTGATLAEDTEITLLEVDPAHAGGAAILVARKPKDGAEVRTWYAANTTEAIRLELPGSFTRQVLINAARDGEVFAAVYAEGARSDIKALKDGEVLDLPGLAGVALRLDAVLQSAAPSIAGKGQEVLEAVLDTPQGEIALREGAMRADDAGAQLRFRRLPQPPRARYALSLSGNDSAPQETTLDLGESVRRGRWTLTYARETLAPTDIALLRARRSAFTPTDAAGALPLFAACYGLVITRALMRRRRDYSSSSEDDTSGFPPTGSTGGTTNAVS